MRVLTAQLILFAGLMLGCAPIAEKHKYVEDRWLRRWSVSDEGGKLLASECKLWSYGWFPTPTLQTDDYPAAVITVAVGQRIVYEDNLGLDSVTKSRIGEPLPGTEEFWCADFERSHSGGRPIAGLECMAVLDPSPAAQLESLELVNAGTCTECGPNPPLTAGGFRAHLRILGPGPVTLGVPESCTNKNFTFSYRAMVVLP